MATIEDLPQKSFFAMSHGERLDLIKEIRFSRRTPSVRKRSTKAKSTKVKPKALAAKLTPQQRQELLAMIGDLE